MTNWNDAPNYDCGFIKVAKGKYLEVPSKEDYKGYLIERVFDEGQPSRYWTVNGMQFTSSKLAKEWIDRQ